MPTGVRPAEIPSAQKCSFPGCSEFADHRHHVTYEPEVVKPLCRRHHVEITIINRQQARRIRRSLSNRHRWWIWFQWTQGKLRARRTSKAVEYIDEWECMDAPVGVVPYLNSATNKRKKKPKI